MAAAIEILGFEKSYSIGFWRKRQRSALRPLNLTVEEGEIFGYLGPNGAGKTTTLKLLMGLIFPTAGTAKILGREISDRAMKMQIGYLPEQPYFYDYLTAPELLEYYAQLSGVPAQSRSKKIQEMLERVGLSDVGRLQLRKFSKGMLQRVGIAQAILHDPKVVFLDEPMSGLDPMGRREVRDLIQSLKDEGKTVFFSTHILPDAESLCDRVAVLHKGELRAVGAVSKLTATAGHNVEVSWQGPRIPAISSLSSEWRITGDTVRAVLPESSLERALDLLRGAHARLVSVTPVRMTLEQYFMEQLGSSTPAQKQAGKAFAAAGTTS